jgi:uncharacterized damage-inducible protein DinB
MRKVVGLTVVCVLAAGPALAQSSDAGPLSASLKRLWDGIKRNIQESAEKMPAEDYAFKPAGTAPEVRTFGQILAHVAAAHLSYCGRAAGDRTPEQMKADQKRMADLEQSGTKEQIVKAIGETIAYCDSVYASLTDAKALELLPGGQTPAPRAQPLIQNIAHDNEHYGNLVTYFRAKGMVPPSTERAQQIRR